MRSLTTRSSQANSAKRPKRFGLGKIGIALGGVLALVGCGVLAPEMGSYTGTIPAALKGSDLGVVEVAVGSGTDGLSRNVGVHVYLDHDQITAPELRDTISLIVPLIDQPGADTLELTFSDASGGFNVDSDVFTDLSVAKARQELLTEWGAGKQFGFSDSADDLIRGKISLLRQYLTDTGS